MSAALKMPRHFVAKTLPIGYAEQAQRRGAFFLVVAKSTVTVPAKGTEAFGDIEVEIDCPACDGSRRVPDSGLTRACPVCNLTAYPLMLRARWAANELLLARGEAAECTDAFELDFIESRIARALADLRLFLTALKVGAR